VYEICMMLEMADGAEEGRKGTCTWAGLMRCRVVHCSFVIITLLYFTLYWDPVSRIKVTGYKSQRTRTIPSIQTRTRARRSIPINA
jgi:hypothetical protein